jgi:hypothetical protein
VGLWGRRKRGANPNVEARLLSRQADIRLGEPARWVIVPGMHPAQLLGLLLGVAAVCSARARTSNRRDSVRAGPACTR